MSQNWTDDVYDQDHVVDTDMENTEYNFATLKSAFSGASSPSNPVAGMPWLDTGKKLLKRRNIENTAWYGMLWGDGNFKIPVYRNDAMDGFAIDSGVSDVVIALKGGSQAYNVSGGQVAGSWTQPYHTLTVSELPSHNHTGTTDSGGGHSHSFGGTTPKYGSSGIDGTYGDTLSGGNYTQKSSVSINSGGSHTHGFTTANKGGGSAHNHGSTYRPYAAVCTLQYPDI